MNDIDTNEKYKIKEFFQIREKKIVSEASEKFELTVKGNNKDNFKILSFRNNIL